MVAIARYAKCVCGHRYDQHVLTTKGRRCLVPNCDCMNFEMPGQRDLITGMEDVCMCGHKRIDHIDEHGSCIFNACKCEEFKLGESYEEQRQDRKDDAIIQHVADLELLEEVQKLLKVLAENYTEKTKLMAVPYGTTQWPFIVFDEEIGKIAPHLFVSQKYHHEIVHLVRFFGMYVGYCRAHDILVFWKP